MKHVHPQTRLAIIRQHERQQRIRICLCGRVIIDSSIETLRMILMMTLRNPPKDIIVNLDEVFPGTHIRTVSK